MSSRIPNTEPGKSDPMLPHDALQSDIKYARVSGCLADQIAALHLLAINGFDNDASDGSRGVISCLLHSSIELLNSFSNATSKRDTRSAYVLARACIETLVNASYIHVSGPAAAELARRHMRQKSARGLDKTFELGDSKIGLKWTGDIDSVMTPEIQSAISDFTTNKGKEKNEWTDVGIERRIFAIANANERAALTQLHIAYFSIYKESSEIIHGSFYGAMFLYGMTDPNSHKLWRSPDKMFDRHHCLFLTIMMVTTVRYCCGVIAESRGLPHIVEVLVDRYKAAM